MPQDLSFFPAVAEGLSLFIKIGFIVLASLYFLFSLIVVRQVKLMTQTLVTAVSPILKTLSIIHAVLALGLIIFFIIF